MLGLNVVKHCTIKLLIIFLQLLHVCVLVLVMFVINLIIIKTLIMGWPSFTCKIKVFSKCICDFRFFTKSFLVLVIVITLKHFFHQVALVRREQRERAVFKSSCHLSTLLNYLQNLSLYWCIMSKHLWHTEFHLCVIAPAAQHSSFRRNVAAVVSHWLHCVRFYLLEIWASDLLIQRQVCYCSTIWHRRSQGGPKGPRLPQLKCYQW